MKNVKGFRKSVFVLTILCTLILLSCNDQSNSGNILLNEVKSLDKVWVLKTADEYLQEAPITLVDSYCERSAGGKHDFYSEGDYWWPDPENPGGPYQVRDGMSNPDNFQDHRKAMVRLSRLVPALVAAWKISGDSKYVDHALIHLRAWFVSGDTKMSPALEYSQAIMGRVTGRGVGLIDTIHLVEVARAIYVLKNAGVLPQEDGAELIRWFEEYLEWFTTHEYGIDERDRTNNHGSAWVLQASAFAQLTGNDEVLEYCRDRFKTVLLPNQLAQDGSFPKELKRTKPFGYMLFNMDVLGGVAHLLSTTSDNLWNFTLPDGQSLMSTVKYMYPFINDKSLWTLAPDVMYYDEYPVRHPSLLFAFLSSGTTEYYKLWKTLDPNPQITEVIRNFPIRQPVLWLD